MVSSKEYAALVRCIMARQKSAFLSSFGVAFQIFKLLAEEVIELGGSDDDLRSLQTNKAKRRKVAEAIIGDRSAKKLVLRDGEYLVPVDYGPNPSKTDLEQNEFSGEGSVSVIFDGRSWEKHRSCIDMDETNGDRAMLVKHFDREIESEVAIAEMDKEGYRPATEKEARAFAKAHPELQRQWWIVALGSFAMRGDDLCVAVLGSGSGRRCLDDRWFGNGWHRSRRFLFVRK